MGWIENIGKLFDFPMDRIAIYTPPRRTGPTTITRVKAVTKQDGDTNIEYSDGSHQCIKKPTQTAQFQTTGALTRSILDDLEQTHSRVLNAESKKWIDGVS